MIEPADQHLARLADDATRSALAALGLRWTPVDQNVSAALRFRRLCGEAPQIVGLVGGASSGKSTIFNSLLERQVSLCSAHAHETAGAVAAVPAGRASGGWMDPQLLWPQLPRESLTDHQPTVGRPGVLTVHQHALPALARQVLVDTPDVTSKMSADEGSVTRALLPWFDGVIVVVDEERWFDAAVFDDIVELSRRLGARVWIVFNRNEAGEPLGEDNRRKLARHADQQGAVAHTVSEFRGGAGYRPIGPEAARAILGWLQEFDTTDRQTAQRHYLHDACNGLIRENLRRSEQFGTLRQRLHEQLAEVSASTSLTRDLLTQEECKLLGLGSRYVPLYDLLQSVSRRLKRWGLPWGRAGQVEFEKDAPDLAQVLRRNLEQRFNGASQRLERTIAESAYVRDGEADWRGTWTVPPFDEQEWATRIRAHIEAWKTERGTQTRRSDTAALIVGVPLLLADLLLLGGAGMSLTWAAVSVAGFFGGKGLTSLVQTSPAFAGYQTTVRTYQSLIREALSEQTDRNLAGLPRRHLGMSDPLLDSLMYWSLEVQR